MAPAQGCVNRTTPTVASPGHARRCPPLPCATATPSGPRNSSELAVPSGMRSTAAMNSRVIGAVAPVRLALPLGLPRLGSMRQVAEAFSLTTSTVSQQSAALAREAGEQLIEPEGRRVRLTPAGRRLADHAVAILAAVDAARLDLDPDAEPAGIVRVGGFGTAIRTSLLPVLAELTATHPRVEIVISEYEPFEAVAL